MSKWQYNLVYYSAIGGAVFLMVAKTVFGVEVGSPALAGYAAITTYILASRGSIVTPAAPAAPDDPPTPPAPRVWWRRYLRRLIDKIDPDG